MTVCGAKLLKRDGTCTLPAGWGTSHVGYGRCRKHLGNTPNHRAGVVEQQARDQLARLGVPAVEDPLSALAAITGEVIAWKDQMAGLVNQLTSVRYEAEGDNGSAGEQLRAEVALLERAFDRCEKFLTAMARLNIDERLARISEAQANEIIVLIVMISERLALTPEQHAAALAAVEDYFAA